MKVLSLFDGMACGMIAMQLAGVEVESYDAYEIDKYAIKTAQHNFPMIKEHGDVFGADFTQYEGVDFLIGGSPCTYWSIAQKNNRETEARGIGWELFSQYVRALKEAKPMYLIYENNKSMSNSIRESITEIFGFEPVCINSALVSAQNRWRLYWVGKRNDDGTYSKVSVEQPDDMGILIYDVLDCATGGAIRIPDYNNTGKSRPLSASYSHKGCGEGSLAFDCFPDNPNKQVFDYVAEHIVFDAVCEWDKNGKPTKALSVADGNPYALFEAKDGEITIKGKQCRAKLEDGLYIIRKLTVRECMRLQTVPEWYEFPVSDSQAYKMLGNGWTCEVIAHLIRSCNGRTTGVME